jgi:hypothetical protein
MNSTEQRKIKTMFVLEIVGRPAEHLTTTLEEIIGKIGDEKGVKVLDKKINDPVEMKEQKGFFTTFAEVELELDSILNLAILVFKYMPAHIEIVQPETITLDNSGFNDILNELTRRLHGYDEVARVLQLQSAQMQRKLKELGVDMGQPEKKE